VDAVWQDFILSIKRLGVRLRIPKMWSRRS